MIHFNKIQEGNYQCIIDLDSLYTKSELEKFNKRWEDFFNSDEANSTVIKRHENIITYQHKSWIPIKKDSRLPVLMLFGNPAPHSVRDDIYFSYEGNGIEHRFWKVFRELNYINIDPNPETIKSNFFNLKYDSPFRLGFEVIFTFPSTASKPKWSGVAGLERLFGKKAMVQILEAEKKRINDVIKNFIGTNGSIIAIQKDAFNAIAQIPYNLKKAVDFHLKSSIDTVPIYGTPPTRWLYTAKMKTLLEKIRQEILILNNQKWS